MSSPLLSVIRVEYSILSGRGKRRFSNKKRRNKMRILIPDHLRIFRIRCLVIISFMVCGVPRLQGVAPSLSENFLYINFPDDFIRITVKSFLVNSKKVYGKFLVA